MSNDEIKNLRMKNNNYENKDLIWKKKEDNLKFWIEGQNSFNFLQGQHVFQSWRERKEGEKKKLSELHCV